MTADGVNFFALSTFILAKSTLANSKFARDSDLQSPSKKATDCGSICSGQLLVVFVTLDLILGLFLIWVNHFFAIKVT